MDANQFLAEFGHIAKASNGVGRLRELVLQLAISGRLVERASPETPVNKSLDLARSQREKYEKKLGLRATPLHPPLRTPPFNIPEHWKWTRLDQLSLYIQRGKGPRYAEQGTTCVASQKCVQWSGFDLRQARWVAEESISAYGIERFLCEGDLLWNSTGTGTAGRIAIFHADDDVKVVADSHLAVIRTANALPRYVWCVIASPWVQTRIDPRHPNSLVSGSTQQVELATATARGLPIPCPPVEEQLRIITKVDELMALCDQLEKEQQGCRKLQNALRQSILQAVAAASSPQELEAAWTRVTENFEHLFSEADDVRVLRNLIMRLAIQGRLVKQMESSCAKVDELLSEIDTKRNRLVLEGIVRRTGPPASIELQEEPFSLPRGWKFVRFGQISICRDGQRVPLSKEERQLRRGPFPYYGASGVIDSIDEYIFDEDLLLVGEDGANLINRRTPIAFIAKGRYWVNNHAHVLDSGDDLTLRYLELFINAIDLSPYVTGTAQPKMNQEKMNLIVIAVPPPQEQARIVGRASHLLHSCDTMEVLLREANLQGGQLAAAAVLHLTGIDIEQTKEEPVKAPQTEIAALLRLGQLPNVKVPAPLASLLARHNGEMLARDLLQRFGGDIDAFYAQLKVEIAHGWIAEPGVAEVREKAAQSVAV